MYKTRYSDFERKFFLENIVSIIVSKQRKFKQINNFYNKSNKGIKNEINNFIYLLYIYKEEYENYIKALSKKNIEIQLFLIKKIIRALFEIEK